MDNFLDYLIPIIFVLVFVLSRLFGPKEEQDGGDASPPPLFRREGAEDAEESERAQQLREEIRRKIEERKQQAAGAGQNAPQPAPATRQPEPQRQAARSQQSQQPSYQDLLEQKRREIRRTEEAAAAIRESRAGSIPRSAYEKTRRVARTDTSSLGRSQRQSTYDIRARSGRPPIASEAVATLRDPNSARKGIILREILDKPAGLRFGKEQDRVPSF